MEKPIIYTFKTSNRMLDTEYIVTDKKTGYRKKIRYIEGEKSLDPEKQSKYAVPQRLHISNRRIAVTDPLLIEFLEQLPHFKDKPYNDFRAFWREDKKSIAKDNLEKEDLILDAKILVRKNEGVNLISSAYLLIGQDAFSLSTDEVKDRLYKIATNNPEKVKKAFNNESSKYKIITANALYNKILEISIGNLSMMWYGGGEIYSVDKGKDVFDEFSKYLGTKDGLGLLQAITTQLQDVNPTMKIEDNFTLLEGVGEKTAKNLYTLGFSTFKQLSESTTEEILKKAEEKEINLGVKDFDKIIEQAKIKSEENN